MRTQVLSAICVGIRPRSSGGGGKGVGFCCGYLCSVCRSLDFFSVRWGGGGQSRWGYQLQAILACIVSAGLEEGIKAISGR